MTLYLTPLISSSLPTIFPFESYATPSEPSSFTSVYMNLVFLTYHLSLHPSFYNGSCGLSSAPIFMTGFLTESQERRSHFFEFSTTSYIH